MINPKAIPFEFPERLGVGFIEQTWAEWRVSQQQATQTVDRLVVDAQLSMLEIILAGAALGTGWLIVGVVLFLIWKWERG